VLAVVACQDSNKFYVSVYIYCCGYIFCLRTRGCGKTAAAFGSLIAGHAVGLLWERHTAHDDQGNAQEAQLDDPNGGCCDRPYSWRCFNLFAVTDSG
jgi:hypothetical protein